MTELELDVGEDERAAGRLRPVRRRQAGLLLQTAGCLVLRDALPSALIEALREGFARIFQDCLDSKEGDGWYQVSRREQAVFWERGARWRIFPKLRPPFDAPDLLANPLIVEILEELLGAGFFCKFVSSDTCLRGSTVQAPRRELAAGGAPAPRAYIVNVPLVRCGPENGPIEVWPGGTHLWRPELLERYGLSDDVQDGPNPEMETFAGFLPSRRLVLGPGSVLIRDPGMLHRGTPNPTDAPRTMLTLCYLRRGHHHDYGDVRFNLDGELRARLAPTVQRLFPDARTE